MSSPSVCVCVRVRVRVLVFVPGFRTMMVQLHCSYTNMNSILLLDLTEVYA
jgi:hypothetical protein